MEKYGFVYIWYDKKRKMFYIGSHWGFEDDGYICSSNWMRKAFRRRPQDFKRRILKTNIKTRENTFNEEHRWLSFINDKHLGKKYYNLNNMKGKSWYTYDEHIKTMSEKISVSTKQAMYRPEVRKKYLKGLKNRVMNQGEDVRLKRSISMKNTLKAKYPNGRPGNCVGLLWWNNGTKNKRSSECPGTGWIEGKIVRKSYGHILSEKLKLAYSNGSRKTNAGLRCWTNEVENKMSLTSPGEGWRLGNCKI